jgi:hypothetical protein
VLVIADPKNMEEVRAFADSRGPEIRKILEDRLNYLDSYAGRERTRCTLSPERGYNFFFRMERKNETLSEGREEPVYDPWFVGGLIYYGAGETGIGAPQFSVRLIADKEGWEINT